MTRYYPTERRARIAAGYLQKRLGSPVPFMIVVKDGAYYPCFVLVYAEAHHRDAIEAAGFACVV